MFLLLVQISHCGLNVVAFGIKIELWDKGDDPSLLAANDNVELIDTVHLGAPSLTGGYHIKH